MNIEKITENTKKFTDSDLFKETIERQVETPEDSVRAIQIMRKEAMIVAYKDLRDILKKKQSAYTIAINGETAFNVLQEVIDLLESFISQFKSAIEEIRKK